MLSFTDAKQRKQTKKSPQHEDRINFLLCLDCGKMTFIKTLIETRIGIPQTSSIPRQYPYKRNMRNCLRKHHQTKTIQSTLFSPKCCIKAQGNEHKRNYVNS